ncbi:MAG: branched-chain amino acid ABC transporter permease [Betaproteobacteria bacterium]|nr:branched-chain amino acid ABC transporter permease [Betaproteobacteria bacterium]
MGKIILYTILLLAGLAAPLAVYPVFMMKLLCFALFACAFNLLIGYTGLLSFGHAAFLGGAGYVAGYLMRDKGWSPELGVLAGTVFAALMAWLMGSLAIRRQGIYFTMITLSLSQMLYFLWLQAPFTGGEDGLQGIPRGHLWGMVDLSNDLNLYYTVLGIFLFGFWLIHRTIHSPFGHVLRAIKDNEARTISLGYDVNRFKLLVFVLSGALAGMAGATKVLVLGFETLTDAHWSTSGLVVLMTLVGGLGTVTGPILGAFFIVILENKMGEIGMAISRASGVEWFATLGESVTIVTGLIFVICVLLFRRGMVGEWLHRASVKGSP